MPAGKQPPAKPEAPKPEPQKPQVAYGYLGIPDALWNSLIAAIVTIILSYMAQRNHTATVDTARAATEAVEQAHAAATQAQAAVTEAKTAVQKNTEAVQKTADAISTLPEDAANKVVEKVAETKGL